MGNADSFYGDLKLMENADPFNGGGIKLMENADTFYGEDLKLMENTPTLLWVGA